MLLKGSVALSFLVLTSIMVEAQPKSSVQLQCNAAYQKVRPITKSVVGENKDEKFAPVVDSFLVGYTEIYRNTPSFEEYAEGLKKNNFKGDQHAAYSHMQRLEHDEYEEVFSKLMTAIVSLEKYAGPLSGTTKPLDEGALAYTACLREYMAKALRDLPDHSYFELKKSELLGQIEQREASTGSPDVGASQGHAR